jgi:hypothetical protein
MKSQLQFTLLGATMLYMAWGLALLFAPASAHRLISVGPYDPVSTAFLAIAFVGFAVTFLLGARETAREIVRAAAVILTLIGLTTAFLMFVVKMMPVGFATGISLAVDLTAAGLLFFSEARMDLERQGKRVPTRAPAASKKRVAKPKARAPKARARTAASRG